MNSQIMKEYQENLKKCQYYREKYLLIDSGKEIIEFYNARLMPKFNGYKDPFVNEQKKFMKLITDLDVVNQNIIESHEIWNRIVNNSDDPFLMVYNVYLYKRLDKLHEYIVFDLKHFIDEVIATISVIKGEILNDKILITSIGDYIGKRNNKFHDLDEFKDLFEKLDDLSNSYKHSYANSDFSAIGRDEDYFVALYSKYNNFGQNPKPYVVSIDYIITEFNKFYKFTFDIIDKLTSKLKQENITH